MDVSNKESNTQSSTVSEICFLTLAIQTLLLVGCSPVFSSREIQVHSDRAAKAAHTALVRSANNTTVHFTSVTLNDVNLQVLDDTQDSQSLLCTSAL